MQMNSDGLIQSALVQYLQVQMPLEEGNVSFVFCRNWPFYQKLNNCFILAKSVKYLITNHTVSIYNLF